MKKGHIILICIFTVILSSCEALNITDVKIKTNVAKELNASDSNIEKENIKENKFNGVIDNVLDEERK